MLNQGAGKLNLPAYLKGDLNFRGGDNGAPVFCCPSFLNIASLHQRQEAFFATQGLIKLGFDFISASLMCLISFLAMAVSASNVLAAERALLGNVNKTPLSTNSEPHIVKTISILRQQANVNGSTRVIVGLRVPFAPEGALDDASVAQQRNEIARKQDEVLEKIPTLKQRSESIQLYSAMPFMSLEVNAAELEVLLMFSEITSVEVDSITAPLLKVE